MMQKALCLNIDFNWVSPRVQSHLISLYDYVINTVSLSLSIQLPAIQDDCFIRVIMDISIVGMYIGIYFHVQQRKRR